MKAPINSEKHIVQQSFSTIASTAIENIQTLNTVTVASSATNTVVQGSIVKNVFVEIWIIGGSQQPGSFTLCVLKLPGAASDPTTGEFASLGTYANKKNILYTTQGLVGDANTNPIPIVRQWVKIPKGKQRMGLGDKILVTIRNNTTDTLDFCGQQIYKEYN